MVHFPHIDRGNDIMKKTATLIISSMLVLSSLFVMLDMTANVEGEEIVPGPVPLAGGAFGGGDGSIGNPYIVEDVLDLYYIRLDMNASYVLGNDIDATITNIWDSGAGFTPIGNTTSKFNGSLDGQGFEIINLIINRSTTDQVGLFGIISETASLTGIGLNNSDIDGQDTVGGLVARNMGTITDCYSTGYVTGIFDVGGLVGTNNGGTITYCYSTSSVNGISWTAGGFVGLNFVGNISNCYSTGTSTAVEYTGGFVGQNQADIINCYSTGDANGVDDYAGGFTGSNSGTITNCYSTGNAISFASGDYYGGFIGLNNNLVSNCYSTGNASGDDHVGGFIGLNGNPVSNCYSTGDASGANNVGGFIGLNGNTASNCYSTGDATSIDHYVGGFVGFNIGGTIINSYSTGIVNGDMYVGGFVGYIDNSQVTNCYSTGSATGIFDYVGGFAGFMTNVGTITNCYSTGSASGHMYIGGFVGWNEGPITASYSTGGATGTDSYVGGFVGINEVGSITACYSTGSSIGTIEYVGGFSGQNHGIIANCYSMGNAIGNDRVGGFTGYVWGIGTIKNCYSTGRAIGNLNSGGFAGYNNSGAIIDCFWDTDTSVTGIGIGAGGLTGATGKTTAEMKQQATFNPPWNFTNVWGIMETTSYPYLTPFSTIISTGQVTMMDTAIEDSNYMIVFDSALQPLPGSGMMQWGLETDATGWLSISSFGVISGTPLNVDVGTYYANITATDPVGHQGFYNYTFDVENMGPSITTPDVPSTNTGALYSVDYDSTDDPSTTWNLSGNVTGWLSIDNDGILSGTPNNAQAGIYNVEVTVDDGNGANDTRIFTLTVDLDTDNDGQPDTTDLDDDNDGTPDTSDDFPLDPTMVSDNDGDGIDDSVDDDDDNDNWDDAVEIAGGFDPLDDTDLPPDDDNDGIADFMDSDFLIVTEYNNQTIWNNETVPEYNNQTIWNNETVPEYHNQTIWNNETIPEYHNTTEWANNTIPEYHNTTVWNNGTADPSTQDTVIETPAWAWGAVIAAVVMGVLAVIGFTRGGSGGKPEGVEGSPEPDAEIEVEAEGQGEPDIS